MTKIFRFSALGVVLAALLTSTAGCKRVEPKHENIETPYDAVVELDQLPAEGTWTCTKKV